MTGDVIVFFSPWLRGTGSNLSLKKPNVTVIYLAISLVSLALLNVDALETN